MDGSPRREARIRRFLNNPRLVALLLAAARPPTLSSAVVYSRVVCLRLFASNRLRRLLLPKSEVFPVTSSSKWPDGRGFSTDFRPFVTRGRVTHNVQILSPIATFSPHCIPITYALSMTYVRNNIWILGCITECTAPRAGATLGANFEHRLQR